MAFVSLTDAPRDSAEQFARIFSIPWPCGYEAPREAVARWGAYDASRSLPDSYSGRELSPTLYLLGPDGRVLWCDSRGRMQHGVDPAIREGKLEAAIERALASPPDGYHAAASLPPQGL